MSLANHLIQTVIAHLRINLGRAVGWAECNEAQQSKLSYSESLFVCASSQAPAWEFSPGSSSFIILILAPKLQLGSQRILSRSHVLRRESRSMRRNPEYINMVGRSA